MSTEVFVLNKSTGLIGIPKSIVLAQDDAGNPTQRGWEVEYFLNGAINVNDYVRLESRKVTGYFVVQAIQLTGSNNTGDWKCTAKLLEVKG